MYVGYPPCVRVIGEWMRKALIKVGIKDFTYRSLHHTFATRLAQNSVDIYKVARLLNHKNLKNTQRYSHHCQESLMDGIQVLEKSDYNGSKRWLKTLLILS